MMPCGIDQPSAYHVVTVMFLCLFALRYGKGWKKIQGTFESCTVPLAADLVVYATLKMYLIYRMLNQGWIQDFPDGGGSLTLEVGVIDYQKLLEN